MGSLDGWHWSSLCGLNRIIIIIESFNWRKYWVVAALLSWYMGPLMMWLIDGKLIRRKQQRSCCSVNKKVLIVYCFYLAVSTACLTLLMVSEVTIMWLYLLLQQDLWQAPTNSNIPLKIQSSYEIFNKASFMQCNLVITDVFEHKILLFNFILDFYTYMLSKGIQNGRLFIKIT